MPGQTLDARPAQVQSVQWVPAPRPAQVQALSPVGASADGTPKSSGPQPRCQPKSSGRQRSCPPKASGRQRRRQLQRCPNSSVAPTPAPPNSSGRQRRRPPQAQWAPAPPPAKPSGRCRRRQSSARPHHCLPKGQRTGKRTASAYLTANATTITNTASIQPMNPTFQRFNSTSSERRWLAASHYL